VPHVSLLLALLILLVIVTLSTVSNSGELYRAYDFKNLLFSSIHHPFVAVLPSALCCPIEKCQLLTHFQDLYTAFDVLREGCRHVQIPGLVPGFFFNLKDMEGITFVKCFELVDVFCLEK
jgi:hypothetical protein